MKRILLITIITLSFFADGFAQNDLKLDTTYFQTSTDSILGHYYTAIPWSQARMDTVWFVSEVTNQGVNTETNVVLSNYVMTPSNYDTLQSVPRSIPPNFVDTLTINQGFIFEDSIGIYSWLFDVSSDSVDGNPGNNSSDTVRVEVTDTSYSRDSNPSGNYNFGVGSSFEIGVMYEVFDTVRATSISLSFGSSTLMGESFSLYLYDEKFQIISAREFIVIDVVGDSAYAIPDVVLLPGIYYVTYQTYTSNCYFEKSDYVADSGVAVLDTNRTGVFTSVNYVPPVSLNISNDIRLCEIKSDIEYYGNHGCDSAVIIPYNGIAPYTFLWENGNTTNYLAPVPNWKSTFVKVTDSRECTKVFFASCYVGVNELYTPEFSIYPNPVSEVLNIEITPSSLNVNIERSRNGVKVNGEYNFELYDTSGKKVLSVILYPNLNTINISYLKTGVYTYKLGEVYGQIVVN